MKFLCINCDEQMKLKEVLGPDEGGSLSAVFACTKCEYKIAMLTNAVETQLISSLGVKIGPSGENKAASAAGSKCPFTAAIQEAVEKEKKAEAPSYKDSNLKWTEDALLRLNNIPEFIRPMAKMGIENFARSQGLAAVDVGVLDRAKGH